MSFYFGDMMATLAMTLSQSAWYAATAASTLALRLASVSLSEDSSDSANCELSASSGSSLIPRDATDQASSARV